jgi:hypothetical protein
VNVRPGAGVIIREVVSGNHSRVDTLNFT